MGTDVSAGQRWGRLWPGQHILWAAGIFLLALALRLAWIAYVNPDPLEGGFGTRGEADTVFYYGSALSLAEGEGYKNPWNGEDTNLYPPGYPLVLALALTVFGQNLIVGKLLNAVLGAATALFVYIFATRVSNRRVGIVAGTITAIFPTQVFFSTVLLTEVLFTTLTTAFVLLVMIWTAERRPSTWQLLTLGLLAGFMSLVRAEAVLLILAVAVLWKFFLPSWRQLVRNLAIFVLGVALLVTPWAIRNYVTLGEFEWRARGPGGFGAGLSPDFDEQLLLRFFQIDPPSFGELSRHYLTHPWDAGTVTIRKFARLYSNDTYAVGWIQGNHVQPPLSSVEVSRWSTLADSYYFTIGVLAVPGVLAWLIIQDRRRALVLWFLASWSLVYLPFIPSARYHFPVIPMLAVFAAFVLVSVWDTSTSRLTPRLVWPGLSLRAVPPRNDVTLGPDAEPPGEAPVSPQPVPAIDRPVERLFANPQWLRPVRLALVVLFLFLVAAIAATIIKGSTDNDARIRDVQRRAQLQQIAEVLDTFLETNGSFPTTGGLDQVKRVCVSPTDVDCALKEILSGSPVDPLRQPDSTGYWYASNGQTAILYARREAGEPWSGPSCPSIPPQLASQRDLQCLRLSR